LLMTVWEADYGLVPGLCRARYFGSAGRTRFRDNGTRA
jgi:hypothetical protein